MIRKLSLLVLATALIVSACGRQVTPDRAGVGPGGLSSGFIQFKFRTAAPLDFAHVTYSVVLNTSGTGVTPYAPNGNIGRNYLDYSFRIDVGGAGVNGTVAPTLWQYVTTVVGGQTGPVDVRPVTGFFPSQLILNPNSNGQGTEFTLTIDRRIFNGIQTSSPSASPSATPTASATPTPSPTPTPTPAGATPSPTPVSSPTLAPTIPPNFSNVWYWNYFTSAGSTTLDAFSLIGAGAQDQQFSVPFDVTTSFELTRDASALPSITPASAQITGADITNAP
jgi:hypothetical protein